MKNPVEKLSRIVESESFFALAEDILKNVADPLTAAKCAEIVARREPGGRYYQAKFWSKTVKLVEKQSRITLRSLCNEIDVKISSANSLATQGNAIYSAEKKSKKTSSIIRNFNPTIYEHAARQKGRAAEYLRTAVEFFQQNPNATVNNIHNHWCSFNGSIKDNLDIIKPSDWWAFGRPKWRLDLDFPGSIPGEVYANALFYFAPPTGVAVDPMAGSGMFKRVYVDRKLWQKDTDFNLKLYLFDLHPQKPFIKKHDATKPLPIMADWIFLDPPYFGQSSHLYNGKLANATNYKGYLGILREIIESMSSSLNPRGRLCIFLPKWSGHKQSDPNYDLPYDVNEIAQTSDLKWIDAAFVSRGRQQEPGSALKNNSAKRQKRMRSDTCVLNVFEK